MKALTIEDIKPYLMNMKEYWNLRNQVQHKFLSSAGAERTEPRELKISLRRLMEKGGADEKLKLLVQNSIYNYKTDSSAVDPELRARFADSCRKWREYLNELNESFLTNAAAEMKKQKKAKDAVPGHVDLKVFDIHDMVTFFSRFKVREEEKLVRFQLVYFQVPNLKSIRSMYKELNTEKFDHIGCDDEEFYSDKERHCEEVVAEESSVQEYLNCFKFGVPAGIRYKFMHHFAALQGQPAPIRSSNKEYLTEHQIEIVKFGFKNDAMKLCDDTTFFAFDELLVEFAHKLVTEKDVLFEQHEGENENVIKTRMWNRIVPIDVLLKPVGVFCYFNKKKDKVYSIIKYFLRQHVSKLYDMRTSNTENIIGRNL